MAWQFLFSKTYAGTNAESKMKVTIEYDDSSITTTSVKLRGRGQATYSDWGYHTADTFFITDKDGIFSRIVYLGGTTTKTDADAYISNSFTISKDKKATAFTIPEIWICNDGQRHSVSIYTDTNWRGHAVYTANRSSWKTIMNSGGSSLTTDKYVTDGTAPSITTFEDKENNRALISGKLGKNGNNNSMSSATLYYTTNGTNPTTSSSSKDLGKTSEGSFSKYIEIPSGCTKIKAFVSCVYAEGDKADAKTKELTVKYRYGRVPGTPILTADSYKNNRLTVKQNITFKWTSPAPHNDYLPLACLNGYRIRILKNGAELDIATDSDGFWFDTWEATWKTGNKLRHGATYSCDLEPAGINTITFDPAKFGFVAGDKIQLVIYGNYTDGNNTFIWSGSANGEAAKSPDYTFQNAGVVNVKVNNSWAEGQVYVKVNGAWKEAETVNARVSGAWKESQ